MAKLSAKNASFGSSFNIKNNTSDDYQVIDSKDKPLAMCWINIGIFITNKKGEKEFVSLPVGIPVDTMRRGKEPSVNSEYASRIRKQNQLLDDALSIFDDMDAGDVLFPDNVTVQFLKRRDAEDIEVDDGELAQIRWSR